MRWIASQQMQSLETDLQKSRGETIYGLLNMNEYSDVTKFTLDGSHLSAWPGTVVKA